MTPLSHERVGQSGPGTDRGQVAPDDLDIAGEDRLVPALRPGPGSQEADEGKAVRGERPAQFESGGGSGSG
jgi:hypothetical protein